MRRPARASISTRRSAWQTALDAHYADAESGGYYLTADDAADLVLRPHSTPDDATPNPNAVAAGNLVRLAVLTGDDKMAGESRPADRRNSVGAARNLFGHVALLNALDLRLRGAEIVVTEKVTSELRLVKTALKLPFVDRIVLRVADPSDLPASHPAQEKIKSAPSAVFVCIGERCSLPITDPGRYGRRIWQRCAVFDESSERLRSVNSTSRPMNRY